MNSFQCPFKHSCIYPCRGIGPWKASSLDNYRNCLTLEAPSKWLMDMPIYSDTVYVSTCGGFELDLNDLHERDLLAVCVLLVRG